MQKKNLAIFLKFWLNFGYGKSQKPLDFSTFFFSLSLYGYM
jgi:hypothetical protein